MAMEQKAFEDVLNLSQRLKERLPAARLSFHLLSSAGGLFEGQRQVTGSSNPSPRRPYGAAKLEQEACLLRFHPDTSTHVYRPSSVYGFSGAGVRLGLVNVLIQNALRHQVSRIYGNPHTMRDYVLASDIGRFISDRIIGQSGASGTFLLASGKPSSTFEILHRIQDVTRRKIYLRFEPETDNSSHNTYCARSLPEGWHPTDIDAGIRQTALQSMGYLAPQ
jgi:UDP-glucose 4-epimerase